MAQSHHGVNHTLVRRLETNLGLLPFSSPHEKQICLAGFARVYLYHCVYHKLEEVLKKVPDTFSRPREVSVCEGSREEAVKPPKQGGW